MYATERHDAIERQLLTVGRVSVVDLARDFGVMSLPTTFVLDGAMRERSRASGVPSSKDLRAAVLSASDSPSSE